METDLQDTLVQPWHEGCGNKAPLSDWTEGLPHEKESATSTAEMAKNLRLDRPRSQGAMKW